MRFFVWGFLALLSVFALSLSGTSEHVLNIGNLFKFIVASLNVGGRVFHTNPVNKVNHGFYSLNPTIFHSIYEENGFSIEDLAFWYGPYINPQTKDIKEKQHTRYLIKEECSMSCTALKKEEVSFKFPVQWKYK